MGEELACGTCTPALPKPRPAYVAASIIALRAGTSVPSRTAVRNEPATSASARSHHRSDTGLLPQYATRDSGALRGTESKDRAVQDSSAWQTMSIPLAAVTSAGRLRVSSGSTTASAGRSRGLLMPDFTRSDRRSSTQVPVLSEPVPAVVGTATTGGSGPSGDRPPPMGALT